MSQPKKSDNPSPRPEPRTHVRESERIQTPRSNQAEPTRRPDTVQKTTVASTRKK
jgi:hypothetical protein